jgi:hypothetical protein
MFGVDHRVYVVDSNMEQLKKGDWPRMTFLAIYLIFLRVAFFQVR